MSVQLRKKTIAGGKVSLYLDIYHEGKRYYEFLKLYLYKNNPNNKEVLKLAESVRAKRELEIQNSEHGFIPHFKKKANFVEYFEKLIERKYKGDGVWSNVLRHLKGYTGGHIQFSSVTKDWLEEFKNYLLTVVAPSSASNYFKIVNTALNQAVRDEIILSNPFGKVESIKVPETKRTFLTLDEIQTLADTPCSNPEIKKAFLFSCFTGLRYSDVKQLTWSQIKNDVIEFRVKKTRDFEYQPLSPTAKKLLYSNGEGGKILHMPDKKVFDLPTNRNTNLALRGWGKEAGIEKHLTFHVSRHTFATLSLTMGADLYTVSKLLGHKEIRTTQVYAKIVDQKKKEAVNLLPEVEVSL